LAPYDLVVIPDLDQLSGCPVPAISLVDHRATTLSAAGTDINATADDNRLATLDHPVTRQVGGENQLIGGHLPQKSIS